MVDTINKILQLLYFHVKIYSAIPVYSESECSKRIQKLLSLKIKLNHKDRIRVGTEIVIDIQNESFKTLLQYIICFFM